MNTNCETMFLLMNLALDGEISASEQMELNSHLATCPHCQAIYEELCMMHSAMSQMEDIAPSEGFKDRVMAQIANETKTKKVVSFRRQWRGIASVAACGVLCIGLMRAGVLPFEDFTAKSADTSMPESAMATTAAPSSTMAESDQEMRYMADEAVDEMDATAMTTVSKNEDNTARTIQERVAEDMNATSIRWISLEESDLPEALPRGVPPVDQWTALGEEYCYCRLDEAQWQEMRLALGYDVSDTQGDNQQIYVAILNMK